MDPYWADFSKKLFKTIKHGTQDHHNWLRDALNKFFENEVPVTTLLATEYERGKDDGYMTGYAQGKCDGGNESSNI